MEITNHCQTLPFQNSCRWGNKNTNGVSYGPFLACLDFSFCFLFWLWLIWFLHTDPNGDMLNLLYSYGGICNPLTTAA